MYTRRKFFAQSSQAALAAGIAIPSFGQILVQSAQTSLPTTSAAASGMRYETFRRLQETHFFLFQKAGSTIPLRLTKVVKHESRSGLNAPDAMNEKFSLIFRGPSDQDLGQDTYSFYHPEMGKFLMFIVPVSTPRDGTRRFYEAVFNCNPPGSSATLIS
jgi:hypothetical protein